MAPDADDAESGLLGAPRSPALLESGVAALETSACWVQEPAPHSYAPLPLPGGGWRPPRRAVAVASLLLLGAAAAAAIAWRSRRPPGVGVPARGRGELQGKAFAWPDAEPETGEPSAEPYGTLSEAQPEVVRPPFTRAAEEGSPPWATASADPWPQEGDATAGAAQYGGPAADAQASEAGYATSGAGAGEPAAGDARGAAADPRGVFGVALSQETPETSTVTFTETATSTSTTTLPATTKTRTTTTVTTGTQTRTTTSTKATTTTLSKDANAPLWVLPKWAQASIDGAGGGLPTLGDLETGGETTTVRTAGAAEASHTHVASTSVRLAGAAHIRVRPQEQEAPATLQPHTAEVTRTSHEPRNVVVTTTTRRHTSRPPPRPPTLYCWSVMVDRGYEMSLMMVQIAKGVSIFSCDDYTVLSNSSFKLTPLLVTEDIGDLNCDYGGPFYLALNSEIFARAWSRIFAVGRYKESDWTVKIDPDAVFLPTRLRQMLGGADPHSSVYFNNCDEGLHGPLEVISRGGMIAFDRGMTKCVRELSYEWDWAGEDVFLRHCLGLLNVSRVDNFQLLSEDHCFHEDPGKNGCWSGKVAFHPFKTTEGYYKCLWEAEHTGLGDHNGSKPGSQMRAS